MPYEPAERLLRLALLLAGSRTGYSLDEMAGYLGVKRRTAERLRDTLLSLFPQIESSDDSDRIRRWRLPRTHIGALVPPPVAVISATEMAARDYAARGQSEQAALLADAAAMLRASMAPSALRQAEPDLEALMEAEGTALRAGPRAKLPAGLLACLRAAILASRVIRVSYRAAGSIACVERILCPHGILHGGRGWLVANVRGLPEQRLWRLDRIGAAEVLADHFLRDKEFNLSDFTEDAFGVFREEPMDIVLEIAPQAAPDAIDWCFHPSQTVEPQADGSLIIRFRAGGRQELCWHLFTWGEAVVVRQPSELAQYYRSMLDAVRSTYAE